jgi:DNA-binding transcriptional ArsR family regulator|nr:MAG: transcriptional regulator [Bacteroidota bacterium]
MESRRDVFQAIADPTRREIIGLLARKPANVNEIAARFDMSRQAVSLHVKVLEECGVLSVVRAGRERRCSVRPEKFTEVYDWLDPLRKMWESRFEQLDDVLQKVRSTKTKKS